VSETNSDLGFSLRKISELLVIIIIIIIIIIIGKDTILFMQGIYTYVPETNHVLKEYSVAAILLLLFITSCCVGSNVLLHQHPEVCVQCPIWQFSVVYYY
jgi:hypothetical protein